MLIIDYATEPNERCNTICNGSNIQFGEDMVMMPKLISSARSFCCIPDGSYFYVMRSDSVTHDYTPKNRLDVFRANMQYYETALQYDINVGGDWWNESVFAAMNAWAFYGSCDELKRGLIRLQQTKKYKVLSNEKTPPY